MDTAFKVAQAVGGIIENIYNNKDIDHSASIQFLFPILKELSQDYEDVTRKGVATLCGAIGSVWHAYTPECLKILKELAKDEYSAVGEEAVRSYGRIALANAPESTAAALALNAFTRSRHRGIRLNARKALNELKDAGIVILTRPAGAVSGRSAPTSQPA